MIQLDNLSKKIKDEIIFTNINFTFNQNTIYLIEGQNGLGKSTLLKIIGGLLKPNAGKIIWTEPHHRGTTGYLFDQPLYIHDLSFSDNLRFLGFVNNLEKSQTEAKINYFSELFQLPKDTKKTVKKYSSGMKKKVELSISLFKDPNCLIWDEPFNFLDDETIEIVLKEILFQDKMFIIASPNQDLLSKFQISYEPISFKGLKLK